MRLQNQVGQLRWICVLALALLALLVYFSHVYVNSAVSEFHDQVSQLKELESGQQSEDGESTVASVSPWMKRVARQLNSQLYVNLLAVLGTLVGLGVFVFEPMARTIQSQFQALQQQQNRELAAARDRAEDATRQKSAFLANMSHEIRTPLNGVLGMSELLLRSELSGQQRSYLETVQVSAKSLLTLLNDILDFSKIEAGKLELEKRAFRPEKCVTSVLQSLSVIADEKAIQLSSRFDENQPDKVVGDENRLRQILFNLIGNAIKFTHAGSVMVRVRQLPSAPEQVRLQFQITDTGIGIAESSLQAVFEAFSQAESSTARQYGGTGLGLSISSQLVTLMHGELRVESKQGEGSKFWFDVVFDRDPSTGESKEDTASPRSEESIQGEADPGLAAVATKRQLNVLVADDSAINQCVAEGFLKQHGHHVFAAANGQEAVAACQEEDFDLILMDLMMPGTDGLEATQRIRQSEQNTRIPIIGMSASPSPEVNQRCRDAGMDAHLSKPYSAAELNHVIAQATSPDAKYRVDQPHSPIDTLRAKHPQSIS